MKEGIQVPGVYPDLLVAKKTSSIIETPPPLSFYKVTTYAI